MFSLSSFSPLSRRLLPSPLFCYTAYMTIQQTITIPADRRVYFDLPLDVPAGAAKFELIITPFLVPQSARHKRPFEGLFGCAKDSGVWDGVDASNPPMLDEIADICDFAKTLPRPEGVYQCDEILDVAAKTAEAGQAREFRLMAAKIRYHLSHPELWSESVRTVRAMRDEWNDPWERERNG
jgi:hypothetical protein